MLIAFEKEKPNTSQNRPQLLTQDLFKEAVKREKWFAFRLQHCALIRQNIKEEDNRKREAALFFLSWTSTMLCETSPRQQFFWEHA